LPLVALCALCALLAAFALAPGLEIGALRNFVLYRLETAWRGATPAPEGARTATLRGVVHTSDGASLEGATVVAADEIGRAYAALSDARGAYTLSLPAGTYAPWATHSGMVDEPLLTGPFQRRVTLTDGEIIDGNFAPGYAAPRAPVARGLVFTGDLAMVHTAVLAPADVRRREFSFARAGFALSGLQLYEPPAAGRYPALIIIIPCATYPCSVLAYDLLSATFSAQGYVVVAYSPQRGLDIEGDVDDLLALMTLVRGGAVSPLANGRLALMTGSLTSIHLWRAAQLAPANAIQGIVVLGGLSDLFLIRQRFEEGTLPLDPLFAEMLSTALIGLGRPNQSPEWYVRYSPLYHLDALPATAIAIVHGGRDKIVPYEQSTRFADAMRARGIAHTSLLFPNHEHYLDLENVNAEELDMLDKVLGFLRQSM
jgi:acetyl esterase/lipase